MGTTNNRDADTTCKWQAKFVCMSKQDKLMLLYDHEPNSETLSANLCSMSGRSPNELADTVHFRLDSGVKRDVFVSYWKARLNRFDSQFDDSNNRDIGKS